MIVIREATFADVPLLAELFRNAALTAGREYYTPKQVKAWAAFADEDAAFRDFILRPAIRVAEDDTGILGFGGLESDGHISSLYVRPDRGRGGVGSALLSALIDRAERLAIQRLFAETNLLSRPLFERFGFAWVDTETVIRRDAVFQRFIVERCL